MSGILGQMLNSPDVILRRALRFSPGPIGYDNHLFYAGYVGDEPEGTSLTYSMNRVQVINPAAARTIQLPSKNIRAGEVVTIVNRSTSYAMTIQSSAAGAIDIISYGYIVVAALQAAPTAAAHWHVIEVYEHHIHTSEINDLFSVDPELDINLIRHNYSVTFGFDGTANNTKSTTGNPYLTTAILSRFRPPGNRRHAGFIRNNGTNQVGWLKITANGVWEWEMPTLGAWTNAASAAVGSLTGAYSLK